MPHFSHGQSPSKRHFLYRAALLTPAAFFAALGVTGSALLPVTQASAAQRQYRIATSTLEQAITQRFPVRYPVGQLLQVQLQSAQLRMLAASNRIAAHVDLQASGPALQRSHEGYLDLDFALRYEAKDHSVRAHQIQVQALKLSGLSPQAQGLLDVYAPRLGEKALAEVVLHRLRPQEAAMLDNLGLQPEKITVTDQGLDITLGISALESGHDDAP